MAPTKRSARLASREVDVDRITDALEHLLTTATVAGADPSAHDPLRHALDAVAELDPTEVDLAPGALEAAQRAVVAGLASGELGLEAAREQITAASVRAAADDHLAEALSTARHQRAQRARQVAEGLDWTGPLTDAGRRAAADVAELAAALPVGTTDASALRGPDKVRRGWLALGEAVGRWSAACDALASLRLDGMASADPLTVGDMRTVPEPFWRWAETPVDEEVLDLRRAGRDPAACLAACHDGWTPAVVDPGQVGARLDERARLVGVNHALVELGYGQTVPGVGVRDARALPPRARALVKA